MLRWPASLLALCALGCTFEDGQPWGTAEIELEVTFAPSDGRLDDAGRLKTSNGLAVQVDALALTVDAVLLGAAGAAAVDFDPSAPPAGYSLCHGGHCHHESGALVPYEEIAAGGEDGPQFAQGVQSGAVSVDAEGADVPLRGCAGPCDLPRGRWTSARVRLTQLRVQAVVFGDGLPDEGVALDLQVPLTAEPRAGLDEPVDRDSPPILALALRLTLPERLFDGLDPAGDVAAVVAENLAAHATLESTVRRR